MNRSSLPKTGPFGRARTWAWAGLLLLVASASGAEPARWQTVRSDEGITTWMRERDHAELPLFRARVRMDASLWQILAVLDDVDRACEWTAHCAEMRAVRRVDAHDLWVYARLDAPWPVRDRDVLTHVQAQPAGVGRFVVHIERTRSDDIPPVSRVVRMPEFEASYSFHALEDGGTEVVYEAAVDPGGALPDWVKRWAGRDFPHDTLSALRERVRWSVREGVYSARAQELQRIALQDGFLAAN